MKSIVQKIVVTIMLIATLAPSFALAQVGGSAEGSGLTRTGLNSGKIAAASAAAFSGAGVGTAFPPGALVAGTGPLITADLGLRVQGNAKLGKDLADAKLGVLETILSALEKTIFETLKKRILDMMVDQIIIWVQGGGEPQFITDWQAFFQDAASSVAGDFAKELGLGFLCSPFSLQLRLSMMPVERFTERASCTLDQIVGNITDFYNDFRNGGWLAFDTSLQMNNNYFGALWLAWDERDNRIADALRAKDREAVTGAGFLSTKQCVDDIGQKVPDTFPGAHCQVVTPGRVIGETVAKAVGSDIDFLLSSDDLAHYIGAIANAAINRLITEGAKGLLGVSTPSAPRPQRGGNIGGIYGAQNFPAGIRDSNTQLNNLQGSFSQQLAPFGNPYEDAQYSLELRLALEQQFLTALQNLYDCQVKQGNGGAKAAVTEISFGLQSTTVTKLKAAVVQNKERMNTINALLKSIAERQTPLSTAEQENALRQISGGPTFATEAQSNLVKAQSTLPNQIEKVNNDLKECKNKP